MCAADKENLVTHTAQELLLVREKEMRFYARNLSMVGTHAALLAGFAFTILSQYQFKAPIEGYLPYEIERDVFGMHSDEHKWMTDSFGNVIPEEKIELIRKGMPAWTWHTYLQQIFQVLHLLFTSLGMTLTLWTLYTCVITNILGVHLALRGPEGSVDRAVRHMAQQNQFALRKFLWGLVLFILSVIFFSLAEYHIFISAFIIIAVASMAWRLWDHVNYLAKIFHVHQEDTVTGQWDMDTSARERSRARRDRGSKADGGSTSTRTPPATPKKQKSMGVWAMGDMLAGKYTSLRGGSRTNSNPLTVRMQAIRSKFNLRRKGGSAWASLHGLSAGGSMIQDVASNTGTVQAPTSIAEQLIIKQQAPGEQSISSLSGMRSPLRRGLTRTISRRRFSGGSHNGRHSRVSIRERVSMRHGSVSEEPRERHSSSCCSAVSSADADRRSCMASPAACTPIAQRWMGGAADRRSACDRYSCASCAGADGGENFMSNLLGLPPFIDELVAKFGAGGADGHFGGLGSCSASPEGSRWQPPAQLVTSHLSRCDSSNSARGGGLAEMSRLSYASVGDEGSFAGEPSVSCRSRPGDDSFSMTEVSANPLRRPPLGLRGARYEEPSSCDPHDRSGGGRDYRSNYSPAAHARPTARRGNGPVGQIPHYRARGRSDSKDSEASSSDSPRSGGGGGSGGGGARAVARRAEPADANLLDQANEFMGSMLGRMGLTASPLSNEPQSRAAPSRPSTDGAPFSGPNSRHAVKEPPSEDALHAALQWSGVALAPSRGAAAESSSAPLDDRSPAGLRSPQPLAGAINKMSIVKAL